MSESEFGSGVIVPLVKFSEHIGDRWAWYIERQIKWMNADPHEREKIMDRAKNDHVWFEVLALDEAAASSERALDKHIQTWVFAASDHFQDLDRSKSPESLSKLSEVLWEIRSGSVDGELRGEADWLRILSLWSEAAMDLDEMLGVRPDWGTW